MTTTNRRKPTGSAGALLVATLAGAFASGCAKDKNDDEGMALAYGVYAVSAPVCLSSGLAPSYPDVVHRAALLDFSGLTSHSLELKGAAVVEQLVDADCAVDISRTVFANEGKTFALRRQRHHTFSPPGCAFTVQVKDVELQASTATGSPFADSEDQLVDVPYDVAEEATGLSLTSRDVPALSQLWESYGCAQPDRLKVLLTLQ